LVPKRIRKRVRGIGHRGVSHTIVFIAICSAVVTLIFNLLVGTPLVAGYFLALFGGLSHIAADALTSYAFPYLAPFSWRPRSLDLDGAVSAHMVPFSLINILIMWGMRAYQFPLELYKIYVLFVFLGIVAHYIARLGVKLYIENDLYRGQGVKVNPTPMLLSFYVMRNKKRHGVKMIEYIYTHLPISRNKQTRRYFEVDRLRPDGGNIKEPKDVYDAVVATSGAIKGKSYKDLSNVAVANLPSAQGQWRMFWFDWSNWNPVSGTKGQLVTFIPGSEPKVEVLTHRIAW